MYAVDLLHPNGLRARTVGPFDTRALAASYAKAVGEHTSLRAFVVPLTAPEDDPDLPACVCDSSPA